MLILAITHAVKIFLKRKKLHITLAREEIYLFSFLIFKHSTFEFTHQQNSILFLYIEKTSFFFLICHCTKRATDNKMNPHVKKISK